MTTSDSYQSDPTDVSALSSEFNAADVERLRPWAEREEVSIARLVKSWVLDRLEAETALQLRRAQAEPPDA